MFNIILGVVLIMLANIFCGVTLAKIKEEFNRQNLLNGLFKIACIGISVGFMYLCSYLNPTIMVVNLNGINVNLIEGIRLIGIAGIIYYGGQSLTKLAKLIKVSTAIQNKSESENKQ